MGMHRVHRLILAGALALVAISVQLLEGQNVQSQPASYRVIQPQTPVAGPLSADDAVDLLRRDVLRDAVADVAVYLWPQPLTPGDYVTAKNKTIWPLLPQGSGSPLSNVWFVWIDNEPYNLAFAHQTHFAFVEVQTGRYVVQDVRWWPTINGLSPWATVESRDGSPTRVISPTSPPTTAGPASAADADPADIEVRAADVLTMAKLQDWNCPAARHWAVLIVLDKETQFEKNETRLKDMLDGMGENGPIQTWYASPYDDPGVTHRWDPSWGDERIQARIKQIFDNLAEDVAECDSVFIHISGHNIPQESPNLVRDKNGKIVGPEMRFDAQMGTPNISGAELAEWLRPIHCCRVTVVLDVCEAASAAPWLMDTASQVIVASQIGESSWYESDGSKFSKRMVDRLNDGKSLNDASSGEILAKFKFQPAIIQTPQVIVGSRPCNCVCYMTSGGLLVWATITPTPTPVTPTKTPTVTPTPTLPERELSDLFLTMSWPGTGPRGTPTPTAIRNIYVGGFGAHVAPPTSTGLPTTNPTATPIPSGTATTGPSLTAPPTSTASIGPNTSATPPPSPSATEATRTLTASTTPTVTSTGTATSSPTASATATQTPTRTVTATRTVSPTLTPSTVTGISATFTTTAETLVLTFTVAGAVVNDFEIASADNPGFPTPLFFDGPASPSWGETFTSLPNNGFLFHACTGSGSTCVNSTAQINNGDQFGLFLSTPFTGDSMLIWLTKDGSRIGSITATRAP